MYFYIQEMDIKFSILLFFIIVITYSKASNKRELCPEECRLIEATPNCSNVSLVRGSTQHFNVSFICDEFLVPYFHTSEDCVTTCKKCRIHTMIDACTTKRLEEKYGICKLPPRRGPCDSYFPRFYYNFLERRCKLFIFGGCESNGNNFESQFECMSKCGMVKILYGPSPLTNGLDYYHQEL